MTHSKPKPTQLQLKNSDKIMTRLESANPTPREIYQQVCADYQELTQLFGRQDHPNSPDLVLMYRKTRTYRGRDVYYLRFQPPGVAPERKETMRNEIFSPDWTFSNFYSYDHHFIALDQHGFDGEGIYRTEAHEVTHAAVPLENGGALNISVDQLKEIRIPPWYKGHDIYTYQNLKTDLVQLAIDEFCTPLGEAYLLGQEYRQEEYYGLPERLPQLAGAILVELYGRDIRTLVMEHPQIAHLSSDELWDKYCKPILTGEFKI